MSEVPLYALLETVAHPLLQKQTVFDVRKVDVRLPRKGNSTSHGAMPVHLIITMIKWIRTSRLSIKNSLSLRHSASVRCRRRSPAGVVVLLGSRFLSHTTRSERKETFLASKGALGRAGTVQRGQAERQHTPSSTGVAGGRNSLLVCCGGRTQKRVVTLWVACRNSRRWDLFLTPSRRKSLMITRPA